MDRLGRPRAEILGYTMPGFATGAASKDQAWRLMTALGIAGEEIDIRPAANQMLADMDHPFARGETLYDTTFENVQAGLRTRSEEHTSELQSLMRISYAVFCLKKNKK